MGFMALKWLSYVPLKYFTLFLSHPGTSYNHIGFGFNGTGIIAALPERKGLRDI